MIIINKAGKTTGTVTALRDLATIDPQRAQIVEMRFFGGMSTGDIATVLGVSEPTVKRRWASTRAWLRHRLGQP